MAALSLAGALPAGAASIPTVVRGGRAVLLNVEKGPLTIRVTKRDLNIYEGEDPLTAQLFDPERRLAGTLSLPDDGNAGRGGAAPRAQSGELRLTCDTPGVYRLVIACGRGDLVFGVDATCPRLVVEGDIVLNDGGVAGQICFQPPAGALKITAQALHAPGVQKLPLLDGESAVLHTFDLAKSGEDQTFQVAAGRRDGLWRFDVKAMDVKLQVPGVRYWSTNPQAFFDPEQTRWMLLDYGEVRYLKPGASAEVTYTLRNRTGKATEFALSAQGEPGIECKVIEPASPVTLKKDETRPVRVAVRALPGVKPGAALRGHLAASAVQDPGVVASAGIEVRVGNSPVSRRLELPIVLKRYQHENALFGYAPDYVANEVYFDRRNRPFIRQRTEAAYPTTALTLLEAGRWVERPFVPALQQAYPDYKGTYFGGGFLGAKVAFDGEGAAYTLVDVLLGRGHQSVLLYTPDEGRSFTLHELPGREFDIEQFVGHNTLAAPPPVLAYRRTANRPEPFASVNDLLLYLPRKEGGKLLLGEPALVSKQCLGSCQHSGGPASTATRDGKTHIVWCEVADEKVPGAPTYVATYDHATGQLGEKVFLAYAPPINDVHNVPAICQDSRGYLHVVAGAHGEAFQYLRSLKPNDAYSGWTKPVPVLSAGCIDDKTDADGAGKQTYISLVCDPEDTLHIAYRQWRRNVDAHHPGQIYAALSVQSKPKEGPWGPARPIVVPPVPGYSIYYHKLTIDRRGRLYLSYSYWTSDESYQNEFPERCHHRAVVVSKDRGRTWKLLETRDFSE